MPPLDLPDKAAAVFGAPAARFGWLGTADGGRLRFALWRAAGPPRATVVLLGGRTEFIEKYAEVAEDCCGRGFAVFALDWRGQGLSSRFLPDRLKGHLPDYDIAVADLGRFLDEAIEPAIRAGEAGGPVVLVAHSMGGQIALRFLSDEPGRVAAAILSAPMCDIDFRPLPRPLVRAMARWGSALGLGERYVPGQAGHRLDAQRFAGNRLTSDARRWEEQRRRLKNLPDLAVGGATVGWLDASFRSMERLAEPGRIEAIDTPVLILSATADRVVPTASHERLARRLGRGTLRRYPDARHELFMETDAIRARVWADIDAFLAPLLAPGPTPAPPG